MILLDRLSPLQAIALLILLVIIAITFIRAGRIAWWMRRAAAGATSPDQLFARATLIAHSTRSLARAAVWLSCAVGAAAISSSIFVMESNRPLLYLVQEHLSLLAYAAMGLGLCALLFAAALGFDLVAVRASRNSRVITTTLANDLGGTHPLTLRRDAHRAPGLIALVLLSVILANLGSIDIADPGQDQFLVVPTILLLSQIWNQLAIAFAAIGVVNWLTTLLQSAMLRRRLSPK